MVVRVLAVVDGGAVTVAANGCGAVAYLLVGVVHAVAIAVDGADAELLRDTPGVGARLSLLGFGAGCPGLEPSGEEPRDCGEQGDDDRCELVDKLYEFFSYWEESAPARAGLHRGRWVGGRAVTLYLHDRVRV